MLNEEQTKTLYSLIRKDTERDSFYSFVSFIFDNSFKTDAVPADAFFEQQPFPDWYSYLRSVLNLESPNLANILPFLKQIKERLLNAERVQIKLAYPPSDGLVSGLYTLFALFIDYPFVIDFELDDTLGLGMKVFLKGMYIDSTASKKIRNYLLTSNVIGKYL